jgi:hypothetical protein
MKNIYILPTEKLSKLYFWKDKFRFGEFVETQNNFKLIYQNIYITSDEEIKERDWWLNLKTNDVDKCTHKSEVLLYNSEKYQHIKKIILTTDQDLIKDGVQAIDDEFLEWFVKNPSCESIGVNKYHGISTSIAEVNAISGDGSLNWEGKSDLRDYKISIPKEEPKTNLEKLPFPELVKEFAEYYKNIPLVEEAKQETLEEVARVAFNLGYDKGVKSQQYKNKYNDEEVFEIVLKSKKECYLLTNEETKEWFEKYKKK